MGTFELAPAGVTCSRQRPVVSAFGSTEEPTTSGLSATTVANTMANWVKTYTLDGIE